MRLLTISGLQNGWLGDEVSEVGMANWRGISSQFKARSRELKERLVLFKNKMVGNGKLVLILVRVRVRL